MRFLSQQHMSVVLLNHQNAGAHVLSQSVDARALVSQNHSGVVVTQAVQGSFLAHLGVVQQVIAFQKSRKHLAERTLTLSQISRYFS